MESMKNIAENLKVVTFVICIAMSDITLQKSIIYKNLCQLKKLLQLKSYCKQKVTAIFRIAIFTLLSFVISLPKKSTL